MSFCEKSPLGMGIKILRPTSEETTYDKFFWYSHLSNNSGGWTKHVGVQKLQNQLDFFHQFLC